ncbi:MAG: hypothetical protein AAF039_00770 [Bacteroidota bacterium]
MKNVCYHLLAFVCLSCFSAPSNNDSIQKWQTIPQKELKAYALILKAKLRHQTTAAFTIEKAQKRNVAFYDEAWLFDFTIKEASTSKKVQLLCVNAMSPTILNTATDWDTFFENHPPNLSNGAAVLDFFLLFMDKVVLSQKDLSGALRHQLQNTVHAPRIMFQNKGIVTIQSFIKEGNQVYLALHKVDTLAKTIIFHGKSNLFLEKNPNDTMLSFVNFEYRP